MAGPNKTLDLVLNGDMSSSDGWVEGAGWLVNNAASGVAAYISTGANSSLEQPTIALVEGATYKFTLTTSGISIQKPTGYFGVQLAGGPVNRITQPKTGQVFYMVAGSSLDDGLQISSVNTTAGDTITIDNVSDIVQHFKPSTDLNAVHVTGDLQVPATGTQELDNFFFGTWTLSTIPDDWTAVGTRDGSNFVEEDPGDGMRVVSDQSGVGVKQTKLTIGKEYSLTVSDITGGIGAVLLKNGTDVLVALIGDASTTSLTFVATHADISLESDIGCDLTVEQVEILELTDGPNDEYVWDVATDYTASPGGNAGDGFGIYNAERVYKSVNTHADGAGGADVNYYVRQRANDDLWYVTQTSPLTADLPVSPKWSNATLISSYTPDAGPPAAIGTATTTFGPTNHSIATGSPGLETDGSAGFIDLKTSFDYLNGLRGGKFAIISVHEVFSSNSDFARIYSMKPSGTNAVETSTGGTADTFSYQWSGTLNSTLSSTSIADDGIHNVCAVTNITTTDSWLDIDGVHKATDLTTDGLNAAQCTLMRLAARADTAGNKTKAKFAFTAILNLSGITTVDQTFSTELSQAINTAALASNYDATAIANAINTYCDSVAGTGCTGVYWPLNEANSGDASSFYLLARDITDDGEFSDLFYGLVSPSGVEGVSIVTGGGYRGRLGGIFRPRYSGQGRY